MSTDQLRLIGEKALCDLAKLLIQKGKESKYEFIEASFNEINYRAGKDFEGKILLTLSTDDLGMDALKMLLPNFQNMVIKRGIDNLIIFNSDGIEQVISIFKYDPAN